MCRNADVIIEVAHPCIVASHGERFLRAADFMVSFKSLSCWKLVPLTSKVGSPTAFANKELEVTLRNAADAGPHGLYIPSGALWGATDIEKMDQLGTLKVLFLLFDF